MINPRSTRTRVTAAVLALGLVLVAEATGARVAHMSEWTDAQWTTIELPAPQTQRLRLEFTSGPSWIAVRALRFRAPPPTGLNVI